jgi:uroporphyrinogen-III decarboxylase
VDRLPVQPMGMMFAARHAGIPYIDYTRDGQKMAEAQLRFAEDFGIDCLLTCSDPAREVIDIAGEGSVDWFVDQGPAINEERAALVEKERLRTFRLPDPTGGGRMHDRVRSIELMRRRAGPGMSIVGWIEGPLALAAELRGLNTIMLDFGDDPEFVRDLLAFLRRCRPRLRPGADRRRRGYHRHERRGRRSDRAHALRGVPLAGTTAGPFHPARAPSRRALRQHMCGRIDPLYRKMAELPVDIYEIDFPASFERARSELGARRVLAGNVSTITDLLQGSPEQVYEACRRCHDIAGQYHIVGAGCELSPFTPAANLQAMVAYARDHRPDGTRSAASPALAAIDASPEH